MLETLALAAAIPATAFVQTQQPSSDATGGAVSGATSGAIGGAINGDAASPKVRTDVVEQEVPS